MDKILFCLHSSGVYSYALINRQIITIMLLRSVSRKPYLGKSPPLPLGRYTPNEDTNNIESSMVVNRVR